MESTALRRIVTPDDLLEYARTLDGKTLQTLHEKKDFTVDVKGDSLIFVPAKRGARRSPVEKKHLQVFCDQFSEKISFSPGDYSEPKAIATALRSFNASYTLTLIAMWTLNVPAPQKTKDHVAELIHREKTTGLSPDEKAELDHYMELEHGMRLALARARQLLPREHEECP